MKTIFLSAMATACCGLFCSNGFGQKTPSHSPKNEEIIIRKNDAGPGKTIIEIDSNRITVNGKPLSEFNGDVTVLKRNFMGGDDGTNFFTPGPTLKWYNHTNTAFLGVLTAKTDKGALINNVIDSSSAKKAGLQKGDIITGFAGRDINSPDDLRNAVHEYKPGDKVTISYLRDGRKRSVNLELGKAPDNPITYNMGNLQNLMNGFGRGNGFNFRMPEMPGNNFYFNNNRASLGLKIEDTEDSSGAMILEVEQGSAAEKAGLKKGDVITEMNGEKVRNVDEVRSGIAHSQDKRDYKLKVKRNHHEMNFDVTIPRALKSIHI